MATVTSVVNMGLLHLGIDSIDSIDNTGLEQARKAKIAWPFAFEKANGERDWPFARKTVALARSVDAPVNDEEYEYMYSLPADYLRMVRDTPLSFGPTIPFTIRGNFLLTNWDDTSDSIYLTYIRKMADTEIGRLSHSFLLAVSYSLAMLLSGRLTKIRGDLLKMYYITIDEAEADARTGEKEDGDDTSESWVTAGR